MIDKKSKTFFIIFIIIVLASISITYYKYVILEKFNIFTDQEAFDQSLLDQ